MLPSTVFQSLIMRLKLTVRGTEHIFNCIYNNDIGRAFSLYTDCSSFILFSVEATSSEHSKYLLRG